MLNNNLHVSEHTGMEVSLEAAEREVASARQLKHPNSASARCAYCFDSHCAARLHSPRALRCRVLRCSALLLLLLR